MSEYDSNPFADPEAVNPFSVSTKSVFFCHFRNLAYFPSVVYADTRKVSHSIVISYYTNIKANVS